MNIKDFIKSPKDRLFIVDYDCYIIYSGHDILYKKPFIRIGTWKDMPAELIPLIETIILTEKISGNLYYEQFNTNLTAPEECTYIGRSKILRDLINFMKTFALDLERSSRVTIEKDIPEISRKKISSGSNEFIGLFLENGNFQISYNDDEILNIEKIGNNIFTVNKILDEIHNLNRNSDLYKKSGFIIFDHRPVFYHKSFFTFFQPAEIDYELLLNLNIDPLKIENVINFKRSCAPLFPLIKWFGEKGKTFNLISDNEKDHARLKEIFDTIKREKFSGLKISSERGYSIKRYGRSDNIKITVKEDNSHNELLIALINDSEGINEVLSDKTDIILIDYSLYEKINLIFKSTETPLAVIDDGNPNISRLESIKIAILRQSNRYAIEKYSEFEDINTDRFIDGPIYYQLLNHEIENENQLLALTENEGDNLKRNITLFNIRTMLYLIINNTSDRSSAITLGRLAFNLGEKINKRLFQDNSYLIRSTIVLFNKSLFHFISPGSTANKDHLFDTKSKTEYENNGFDLLSSRLRELKLRITNDRERLNNLLTMLLNYHKTKNGEYETNLLGKTINDRKALLLNQNTAGSSKKISKNKKLQGNKNKKGNFNIKENTLPAKMISKKRTENKLHCFLIISAVLIFSAILFLLNISVWENNHLPELQEKKKNDINKTNNEELIKKYNITIHDKYIYKYANKLALKNSYRKISSSHIDLKSPHLIFPGDTLTMLDETEVIVGKGDTLWKISEKKLLQKSLKFYELMEIIKKAEIKRKKKLISEAENYIITEKEKNILDKIKSQIK